MVADKVGISPELICSGSRKKKIADARALLAHLAVEEVGHPAAEVARFLGISRMGVQKAVLRGKEFGRYDVSLAKDAPNKRPVQDKHKAGKIIELPRVGGLHHRYE